MHSIRKSALSGLTLRLLVCGIPTYAVNPFAGLLVRWMTCSGEEWTVRRCKALKLTLIQLRAKSRTSEPLARNRRGEIAGVVGSLMRWGLKSDKNFSKVLAAFMAYSHWTSSKVTSIQRKKFLDAVRADPCIITDSLKRSLARTTREVIGRVTIHGRPQPLLTWKGSPNKRAPTLDGSVAQSEKLLLELKLLQCSKTRAHVSSLWDEIYSHCFEGIAASELFGKEYQMNRVTFYDTQPMVAGEVHFLQEPGYKLRSIASPYRLFQVASEPLKDTLGLLVRSLPWDCTHGQDRAFPIIQEALKQGREIYSVDLSNATDYFPFELQKIVLETIFGEENPYVYLFSDIASSTWHSELGDIVWNRGQPLGFNPSFFTFTLTHGLLLLTLLGRKWDHEFLIVGDDVVILDRDLHVRYLSTLDQLGCPYSKDKTLVSCELAEFAGKVITQDIVIPQLKWHDVSDDNFLDLARLIGRRIRLLLSAKQQRVLDVFSGIPDFVHPYGLNWSYPGSNLESMISAGLQLAFKERVLDSLTGLSRHIHGQLYADYGESTNDLVHLVYSDWAKRTVQTFDEKVKSVFLQLGFARHNDEYFLEGLKDIPRALLPLEAKLPFEEKPPSRVTLLKRLSRYLVKGT